MLLAAATRVDQGASWGGPVAALIAAVLFVGFAVWIVVQRVRNGPADDAATAAGSDPEGRVDSADPDREKVTP